MDKEQKEKGGTGTGKGKVASGGESNVRRNDHTPTTDHQALDVLDSKRNSPPKKIYSAGFPLMLPWPFNLAHIHSA